MRKSTKAALLSALVFPGLGHFILKSYWRAALLVLAALSATYVIFDVSMRQAMSIVDSITAGDVPLDSTSITELVASSSSASDASSVNIAVTVLAVSWLIGVVDSWRLGSAMDKKDAQA